MPRFSPRNCGRSLAVLTPMFVAMILCWTVGRTDNGAEFYPLSSFPMYSKFDDRTYLVYLKSNDGEPLGTVPAVNAVASELKKQYGDDLQELKKQFKGSHFDWSVEQKKIAGEATLRYLRDVRSPDSFRDGRLDGLRLVDLRIFREGNRIVSSEEEVAQLPAN